MSTKIPTPEPEGYAVTAAELTRLAYALDTLPTGDKPLYVQMHVLPGNTVEDIDAVAFAMLGKRGATKRVDGGGWRHSADGTLAKNFYVSVFGTVPGPPDERDAEIERLRAELAEARVRAMPMPTDPTPTRHLATMVDRTGMGYSREAEDPEPGVVADGIEGGSVTGRASVPDRSMPEPCQPIGCDNGYHLPGCPYEQVDDESFARGIEVRRASVPDMQTRPQCSPECAASPFVQRHIADCPVRAAEPNGGE